MKKSKSTSSAANGKSADNEVDFGGGSTASDNKGTTSTTRRQNKTSTTSKAKEPATDSEGWVTKMVLKRHTR
ncbi:MAG: hypothetical protein L6V88_01495 [Anaerotruncus sp.]|nr:MAG: hypothetical protein L6V88_01495 [Anaerotruncus sp.]